jgi:hypothetical protein
MTIGAVGYSTNFESPQYPTARIHRNIQMALQKQKIKENPFSLKIWGPYRVDPRKKLRP